MKPNVFDKIADQYQEELARGLSLSGEGSAYYALKRIEKLAAVIARFPRPARVMDYGCGTGGSIPYLSTLLGADLVVGVDVSEKSIEQARLNHQASGVKFYNMGDYECPESMDLVFCNGVFHHIPPPERSQALAYIFRHLRSGGLFAFWENNPVNIGTQYAMKRTSFDRDAIKISQSEAVTLLRDAGFRIEKTLTLFLFPRWLKPLRAIEHLLLIMPIGAQYLVLVSKP